MASDFPDASQNFERDFHPTNPFHSIFIHSASGMAVSLMDGTFLHVNPAFCRMVGYPEEELLDLKAHDITHPEDREQTLKYNEETATGKRKSYTYEKRYIRKDGTFLWGIVTVALVYDKGGQPSLCIGMVQDITSFKQAQEKMLAEERIYRLLIENIRLGISFVGKDRTILMVNPTLAAWFGKPVEEIIGKKCFLEYEKSSSACPHCPGDQAMATGRPQMYVSEGIRDDGSEFIGRVRVFPLQDSDGEGKGYIEVVENITEQKKAEEALECSEKRFRAVFEQSSMGMCVVSPEGRFLQVNQAICTMLGYSEPELLTMNTDQVVVLEEGKPGCSMKYQPACGSQVNFETRYRCRGGSVLWAFVSGSWIFDSAGKVLYGIGILKDITEQKEAQEKLDHLAFHDPLTGLPNRALLMDRLEHALARAGRSESKVAIIFFDLDRFKDINDTYDHLVGDEVLRQLARRLSTNIREADTLARFGGDEFVIVSEDICDTESVAAFAQKVQDLLQKPISVGKLTFHLSASMGISLFPRNGRSAERLLRSADAAMYRSKENGRNMFQIYNSRADARSRRRGQLESELRSALEEDLFILHYQPQFNLITGDLFGFEALIRWRHPGKGLILPGHFISLAEETGLILPLGRWVLMEACRQAKKWRFPERKLRMSLNISARQFLGGRLVERISEILEETGLPPRCLELELTESVIMENVEQAVQTMQKIAVLDVPMTIDNFGTGFSSLAQLKEFPVRRLKIDRSFVKGLPGDKNSAAIASSIIGLARNMDLEVIAEGIETPEQMAFLTENGCWFGQGFLLAKPESAAIVAQYLEDDQESAGGTLSGQVFSENSPFRRETL